MKYLGMKFNGHDSAICILDTYKKEIFAISTERVTRIKHDSFYIKPILDQYNIDINEFNVIGQTYANFEDERIKNFYFNSIRELEAQIFLREYFKPKYIKDWVTISNILTNKSVKNLFKYPGLFKYYFIKLKNKILIKNKINSNIVENFIKNVLNFKNKVKFIDHHLSHAIGSYYTSKFVGEKVLSLTLDGHGDGFFSKLFLMENSNYEMIGGGKTIYLNDTNLEHKVTSIGVLYSVFTKVMGLTPSSDEGKVEALAAYGKKNDKLYNELKKLFKIEKLNWIADKKQFEKIYTKGYLSNWREKIGDENFCATIQTYLEDIVVEYLNKVSEKYPNINKLCLSGGVAANIIMSLNIFERTNFKNIHIMPAMADDGTALGASVLLALENGEDLSWISENCFMPYYGPSVTKIDIEKTLEEFEDKISFSYIGDLWYKEAANDIANKKIIALFNGRMEFGPRALGNRSIVANAMDPNIKDKINSTVKRRPWYQPFCPSILEEEREKLFEESYSHKHMAIAFRLKEKYREILPGACHIDGTARPQFVEKQDNLSYYNFLQEVKKLIGYGVVINTSFNLHGRTIVRTVEDAITDFIDCNIDTLYLEGYKIERKN